MLSLYAVEPPVYFIVIVTQQPTRQNQLIALDTYEKGQRTEEERTLCTLHVHVKLKIYI